MMPEEVSVAFISSPAEPAKHKDQRKEAEDGDYDPEEEQQKEKTGGASGLTGPTWQKLRWIEVLLEVYFEEKNKSITILGAKFAWAAVARKVGERVQKECKSDEGAAAFKPTQQQCANKYSDVKKAYELRSASETLCQCFRSCSVILRSL